MTASSLLDPLPLRDGVRAPNRIVFAAHVTNLAADGLPSERMCAYYARRARGGAGIVVLEEAFVHPSSHPYERALRGEDPAIVPAYRRVADAVHAAGALAFAQLGHAGMQGSGHVRKRVLWAPSAVPNPATLELPKVMEPEDVAAVVEGFALAARHAVAGGLDGVEVNAGQHSLVRQFLSGLTNQRDDAYGGDPERRLRFAREVIAAVRREVKDGVVGLRLCCDELAPWAGIRPEDAPELAVALAEGVNYLSVVAGSIFSVEETRPGLHRPPGHLLGLCGAVRDRLGIPVFASGSLVDPDQAAAAVVTGQADACEMTRALIADPDLPRRLAEHRPDAVRPCIRCNQDCAVRSAANAAVSCVHNPEAGHEADFPAVVPAAAARHVVVVGGGPAGLEAARTAALHGHRVRVVDRAARPGGAVRAAAAGAGRERLAQITDWLASECARLGVELDLGRELGGEDLEAHDGAVLICTGSRDGRRDYLVEPTADVRTARSVLEQAADGALPDGPCVIWDPVGGPIGISVAELLAAHRQVALVTHDLIPGTQLARSGDLADASTRLQRAGVALYKRSRLVTVTPAAAVVEDVFTGGASEIDARVVIDAGHRLPEDTLWRAHPALSRAGDAVAPRTVYEAVLEGRRAALALDTLARAGGRALAGGRT